MGKSVFLHEHLQVLLPDHLLTFSDQTRAKVVDDCLRGLERGRCESAGAHLFAEFKGSFDLGDFRRSEAGYF
jgi:hypothetical protein